MTNRVRQCVVYRRSSYRFSDVVRGLRNTVRSCNIQGTVATQTPLLRHQHSLSEPSLFHSHDHHAHASAGVFRSHWTRSVLSLLQRDQSINYLLTPLCASAGEEGLYKKLRYRAKSVKIFVNLPRFQLYRQLSIRVIRSMINC